MLRFSPPFSVGFSQPLTFLTAANTIGRTSTYSATRPRPLLSSLEAWLRERLLTLSLQSDTTKAINYMLNQWDALVYYCANGVAEIDNNIVENALRVVSLGRKNLLLWAARRFASR
jgi:hypothetical protein